MVTIGKRWTYSAKYARLGRSGRVALCNNSTISGVCSFSNYSLAVSLCSPWLTACADYRTVRKRRPATGPLNRAACSMTLLACSAAARTPCA